MNNAGNVVRDEVRALKKEVDDLREIIINLLARIESLEKRQKFDDRHNRG